MKLEVKKYLNVFLFLQDVYKTRKESDPQFSYDTWAKELNVKDKSYVRYLVLGKRSINEEVAHALATNLSLEGEGRIYFLTLVQYTQSKTKFPKLRLSKAL